MVALLKHRGTKKDAVKFAKGLLRKGSVVRITGGYKRGGKKRKWVVDAEDHMNKRQRKLWAAGKKPNSKAKV